MAKVFLSKETFLKIERTFRNNFPIGLDVCDAVGREFSGFCSKDCEPEFCRMVRNSPAGAKRCMQERKRGLEIAFETGQSYISICHAGIVLVCVPAMDKDEPLGGIFFGKCLWEKPNEALKDEICKRLKGVRIDKKKLAETIDKLAVFSGRKVHEAAEFLFVTLYDTAKLDPHVIHWRRQKSQQQSEISELIYEQKFTAGAGQYPIECEKQLIRKVKIGDRIGAKEMLNMILASIMLRDPGDLAVLKARMLELLSVLSRSAVEGGVDINFLLEKNLDYMTKVMQIDNQPDLCVWINNALNDFLELVYSTQDSSRASQIKPAIDYIEANYREPVNLADIAEAAYLSVSRLSHIFKEQMGVTLVDYLTSVRIEHAKAILISTDKNCTEACFDSGYNNQSYFTRIFKSLVGVTPKQFREMNRRKKV
ncbi:MAG: PocR ligand-binding domain-containing protein [Anaerohalosphaeraceae bacterium]|nr:PocR ligand-binding domain-containing protein [Anaerohalosphaeraceae bacterium]